MRSLRLSIALIFGCAFCSLLHAQGAADVVHTQPLHVRHFSGTIVDAKGMTIEYATVELRDPKTHRVLASTYADGKGFFAFDDKKYGKRIELRVVQKGFTAAQYTAMLRPFGDEHIHMVLSPAA
jgi:Carboxypeptidase regulatory-like domain